MDRQKEFVLRTLEERDIRFVRLWFTDVLGFLKSVAIAPAELEGAFEEGIGFDGSSIEGFARVFESDTVARPDPSTFQVLPWTTSSGEHHSARMFCDITMPDGSPSWSDSRHVLRRQLAKASDLGFSCYVHPEIEFFLLEPGPYDGSVPVPADNVMTFRYVVKEVALAEGVRASFMPKPFAEYPGSAMHTHMSLFEGETNAFHSPEDPLQLSDVAKSFIAGILEHASEISAVTNQWVNSYKRLVHGGEAPTAASWGAANRSALVRVPMYTPRKASSRRIEVRSPDSACNPYLAFAVLLAAGLRGIEKNYALGPQAEDNVWTLTPEERRAMGYRELPSSLGVALVEMEKSELVAEALGEHVFDYFLRNKRAEWEDYRSNVTPFELKRYLSL
ncbi:MAG: glutamine synthetase [Mycobacteriaceae bacterium]|nr:glutamine synthetase [Mycobacteriaceae bacterium]